MDPDELNLENELATHPHDAFFKLVFGNAGHASEFFKHHLPQVISEKADWETLQLLPGSFVKRDLKQSSADLLFEVNVADLPCQIHLLFEHQTTVDARMPLRLLGYMHSIWTNQDTGPQTPLTPVIPVVLHQGPLHWTAPTAFHSMFPTAATSSLGLGGHLPDFYYLLVDLTKIQPEHSPLEQNLKAALHLMKLARQRDQVLAFFDWLEHHVEIQITADLFRLCLLYALHSDPEIDFKQIYETFNQRQELKTEAMNAVQKLKAEGRMEGRMEGQSEGVWIGRIQLLAELMQTAVPTTQELSTLSIVGLQDRYKALQDEYDRRHKQKP